LIWFALFLSFFVVEGEEKGRLTQRKVLRYVLSQPSKARVFIMAIEDTNMTRDQDMGMAYDRLFSTMADPEVLKLAHVAKI